jgi:two-component system sensor histidine kinase YesM
MFLAVASIIILLSFDIFMSRSITRPLKRITSVLDSIGNGKRKQRIHVEDRNEFGIISESINTMLDNVEIMNHRIFDMQTQLYEKELMQKESEMLTLQSQINPHFLYNTLECIRSIAIIHKIQEISIITTSMSKIFRYSIKGGLTSTFERELDCIKDYYKIIALRYNGRLKINLTVDEKLFPFSILKMSLQPIIENSVYHGLEAKEDEVVINLSCWIENDYAVITIEDNGIGIEPEKVKELNDIFSRSMKENISEVSMSKNSIGLSNINARIKLHYGEDCGLNIQSTFNVSTIVTVKMRLLLEV